jgi:hypothetical protein
MRILLNQAKVGEAMKDGLKMWEIMVPCNYNDGRPVRTRHHKVWDAKVRAISGGMTICKPTVGHWTNDDGEIFKDRMIPVRIACTEEEINRVLDITIKHYGQEASLAYLISERVIIKNKE